MLNILILKIPEVHLAYARITKRTLLSLNIQDSNLSK